ncbi:MAG: hypothetical protein WEC84_03645 [Candidatus Andersenbacteria bacterium]
MFGFIFNRRAADVSGEPWFNQQALPEPAQKRIQRENRVRVQADLRGYVVLINFWDYSRRDCIEALPHLKAWWERYKQFNFIILGVHTPEFAYEGDGDKVTSAVLRFRLSYPVVGDPAYETWERYRCQRWSRNILVDHKGRAVLDLTHDLDYGKVETAIQKQLKLIHPDISFIEPVKPAM